VKRKRFEEIKKKINDFKKEISCKLGEIEDGAI
jgi:hypothetical protein